MKHSFWLAVLFALIIGAQAAHLEEFRSDLWTPDFDEKVESHHHVRFIVALNLRNVEELKDTFLQVSDPTSTAYGKHLSLEDTSTRFGATKEDKQAVVDFFHKIPGSTVKANEFGDLIEITAPVHGIESSLETKLSWFAHSKQRSVQKSLRCVRSMTIPDHISNKLSFISLNSPINHIYPRGAKSLKMKESNAINSENSFENTNADAAQTLSVTGGNEEALIRFSPLCGDGSLNTYNPPCGNLAADNIPTFTATVTSHANNKTNPYVLDTDPMVFTIKNKNVYCFNEYSKVACGGNDASNCTCVAKVL